ISTKEHTEKLGKGKKRMSQTELRLTIEKLTAEMKNAAQILEFEHAAYLRAKIKKLKEQYSANPNLKIMKDAEEKSRRRKRERGNLPRAEKAEKRTLLQFTGYEQLATKRLLHLYRDGTEVNLRYFYPQAAADPASSEYCEARQKVEQRF